MDIPGISLDSKKNKNTKLGKLYQKLVEKKGLPHSFKEAKL